MTQTDIRSKWVTILTIHTQNFPFELAEVLAHIMPIITIKTQGNVLPVSAGLGVLALPPGCRFGSWTSRRVLGTPLAVAGFLRNLFREGLGETSPKKEMFYAFTGL